MVRVPSKRSRNVVCYSVFSTMVFVMGLIVLCLVKIS